MGSGGGGGKPKPTAQEKALAERGAKEHNRYVANFAPLAAKLRDDIRVTDGERASVQGTANADVAMATRDTGTGPSQNVISLANRNIARGSAVGTTAAQASQALDNNELAGLQKLARTGRDLADDSTLGLASSARRATATSIEKAGANQQKLDNVLDLAGYGYGYYQQKRQQDATDGGVPGARK